MQKIKTRIGIFGGSGFYNLLEKIEEIKIPTPYGYPSDKIAICKVKNTNVAFLPRHGKGHIYPPHLIPYLANLYAFKKLGVTRIIAPTAAGSLKASIKPGDFVICDQFVDRTWGRVDSYFQGKNSKPRFSQGGVVHISPSDPYCKELKSIAYLACQKLKYNCHPKGTVVVINGPRFSTKAESVWYQNQGWDVINMTQYPEVVLAKELGICYVNISLITDYDTGLKGNPNIKPVTTKDAFELFNKNIDRVKKLILYMIEEIPEKHSCSCRNSLESAVVN